MPTVLIIGASRGIGLELAKQYARQGWTVHATTRTPEAPGDLGAIEGDLHVFALEVRDPDHIAALAEAHSDVAIDVLIHNAGVNDKARPREEVMEINARAPFQVIEPLMPSLQRADAPKLVLVTSQLGARNGRSTSLGVYGDSKAALNDCFRELESTWGQAGITAIVLHPGWVRTDMGGSGAPLSVEDSVSGICDLVAGLDATHHGGFWNWDGRPHAW